MRSAIGTFVIIGLVCLVWWVPSEQAAPTVPALRPPATAHHAQPDSAISPTRLHEAPAPRRGRRAARVAPAFELPPVMQAAAQACSRAGDTLQLSMDAAPDAPDVEGVHPAQVWCAEGRLLLVQFSKGEDAWITWEHTDEGVTLTVVDYDDAAVRTGHRRWVNGQLLERSTVENLEDGTRRMTIFKDGARARVMAAREGQMSDSTLAALERQLDTLDLTAEQRAMNREARMTFDAYQLEESYHPDGDLKFRSEHINTDDGDGWLSEQIRVDANADGLVDGWILGRRHVDGRSRSVIVIDTDRDGRFDRKTITQDANRQPSAPIDWPVETVTEAQLHAQLP